MNEDIAGMLGVPPADWTNIIIRGIEHVADLLNHFGEESRNGKDDSFTMSRHFVNALITAERGGTRPSFDVPNQLAEPVEDEVVAPAERARAVRQPSQDTEGRGAGA